MSQQHCKINMGGEVSPRVLPADVRVATVGPATTTEVLGTFLHAVLHG